MKFLVMAGTVLKNLFSKPSTRRYPFEVRASYKHTRGKISVVITQCIFCGMCQRKCPTGALAVDKASKKWTINRMRCISCGYCVEVCPKKCLVMENSYTAPSLKKSEESFQNA